MRLQIIFSAPKPLAMGSPAPAVFGIDQDGRTIRFPDIYEKGLTLVYFYPMADTPGCSAQACSLRDAFAGLSDEGLQILGVSGDKPEALRAFRNKFGLPFPLVADPDGTIGAAFHVPRYFGFSKRQSFLIHNGLVVWAAARAKTAEHAEEVRQQAAKWKH